MEPSPIYIRAIAFPVVLIMWTIIALIIAAYISYEYLTGKIT